MDTSTVLGHTLVLLVVFEVKHYIADFPLQHEYMLQKTRPGWSFLAPLSLHCTVHAGLTLVIVLMVAPGQWWLAGFDFVTHFVMDRIKSGPRYLGRFRDVDKPAFWNCFGFDQLVHHLVSYFIIWKLLQASAL